jgi:hypothetical protein
MTEELTFKLIDNLKNNFKNNNVEEETNILRDIINKWEVYNEELNINGNLQNYFYLSNKGVVIYDREPEFVKCLKDKESLKELCKRGIDKLNEDIEKHYEEMKKYDVCKRFINCISSPLLLYRCICIFAKVKLYNNNDKYIWRILLKHKKSQEFLALYEWKGVPCIGFEPKFKNIYELPNEFNEDVLKLLSYLLSDQCKHPYGIISGSKENLFNMSEY